MPYVKGHEGAIDANHKNTAAPRIPTANPPIAPLNIAVCPAAAPVGVALVAAADAELVWLVLPPVDKELEPDVALSPKWICKFGTVGVE